MRDPCYILSFKINVTNREHFKTINYHSLILYRKWNGMEGNFSLHNLSYLHNFYLQFARTVRTNFHGKSGVCRLKNGWVYVIGSLCIFFVIKKLHVFSSFVFKVHTNFRAKSGVWVIPLGMKENTIYSIHIDNWLII